MIKIKLKTNSGLTERKNARVLQESSAIIKERGTGGDRYSYGWLNVNVK